VSIERKKININSSILAVAGARVYKTTVLGIFKLPRLEMKKEKTLFRECDVIREIVLLRMGAII